MAPSAPTGSAWLVQSLSPGGFARTDSLQGAPTDDYVPPWSWPLPPVPAVTRHFIPPPEPWQAGHRGVDLAVGPGNDVLSPADGVVTFVGMVAGRPVLSIGHQGGLVSSFEPVKSTLTRGARVERGQSVGTPAGPPHCPFACIHWGVRRDGEYVNPLNYVTDRRPSVLLPLPEGLQ
ncbi:M23 family metallopeptidase [Arthrobacter frigidicola]|nr:M23 family metallopeptidase [Arthrobacter frigidicola]